MSCRSSAQEGFTMNTESDQASRLQHFQQEHQQLAERLGDVQKLLSERVRNGEQATRQMVRGQVRRRA